MADSPFVFCREMTVEELFDHRDDLPATRRILLELQNGEAPTGQLVKARIQRQVLEDGQLRWKPER
jgi:hypothetical protein